jgi:hypothetical protein
LNLGLLLGFFVLDEGLKKKQSVIAIPSREKQFPYYSVCSKRSSDVELQSIPKVLTCSFAIHSEEITLVACVAQSSTLPRNDVHFLSLFSKHDYITIN